MDCNVLTYRKKNEEDFDHAIIYYYGIKIPKTMNIEFEKPFFIKLNLKHLNQAITLNISECKDHYLIDTNLMLPYYSKYELSVMEKNLYAYIIRKLEDKILKKGEKVEINCIILKNIMKENYRNYVIRKDKDMLTTLILIETKEKYDQYIKDLMLKFALYDGKNFHDVWVEYELNNKYYEWLKRYIRYYYGYRNEYVFRYVNLVFEKNYLLVKFKRSINNEISTSGMIKNVFNRFISYGIESISEIGIDINRLKDIITARNLRQLHIARQIAGYSESGIRGWLLNQHNSNKRHLAAFGYNNYYSMIDCSCRNSHGYRIPEYEVHVYNRNNKSILEVLNDLEFLMDYDHEIKENRINKKLEYLQILVIPTFAIESSKVKVLVAVVLVCGVLVADFNSYNVIILKAVIVEKKILDT